MKLADAVSFRRRFERVFDHGKTSSVIDEMLQKRIPLHFGGMSDPFPPMESDFKASLRLLKVLSDYRYPTVISTKSTLLMEDAYLVLLLSRPFIVQVSLNSLNEKLLKRTDQGTPGPRAILRMVEKLVALGIPVACRIQPLLPQYEDDAYEVIAACGDLGVKHVAVEHLKLPVETQWRGTADLSRNLEFDVVSYFKSNHAKLVGREWILPAHRRLDRILSLREYARNKGLTFGAADNDLLHLSDGRCCCSGIDLIDSDLDFFRFNYTEAVRKGSSSGVITYDSISSDWAPQGSIAQYMNSHSRMSPSHRIGRGVRDYIEKNWNSSTANSPSAFHGVEPTGSFDDCGQKIYKLDREIENFMSSK